MAAEPTRSRAARAAAESALVRIVHHYGAVPEFVLLGGLVPELLCSASEFQHAGTTDIDVQVNLEITCGNVNVERLERALKNAEFEPDDERVWRWASKSPAPQVIVEFELLADLDDQPANATIEFDACERLGAANLRGTRFAVIGSELRTLTARIGGVTHSADINVAGLPGFLLAKCAAAHARGKTKDWYDIAFVLLHNDFDEPEAVAFEVLEQFEEDLPCVETALRELAANFANPKAQGATAYAAQMLANHPDLDADMLRADAVLAVGAFCGQLLR